MTNISQTRSPAEGGTADGETEWDVQNDAIVEQPRNIRKHPLLAKIYESHDAVISEYLSAGDSLELAFGQHMHPQADIGVEAWSANAHDTSRPAIVGDARSLPFEDNSFDSIIGRRFLHHVPADDRSAIIRESARVLRPGGRIILLEGTPGLYRRVTKETAFTLGLLDEDTDLYGHLSDAELYALTSAEFEIVTKTPLGSPLTLAGISESALARYLYPLYRRTQFITWWTLIVGEKPS